MSLSKDKINYMIEDEMDNDVNRMLLIGNIVDRFASDKKFRKKYATSSKNKIFKSLCDTNFNLLSAKNKKEIENLISNAPRTKGKLMDNMFNEIINIFINSLTIRYDGRFEFGFKSIHKNFNLPNHLDKVPDWYIYDKLDDKILYCYNRRNLWHSDRDRKKGMEYIVKNKEKNNTDNMKILFIVADDTSIKQYIRKGEKTDKANIFETGFENDTLCYLGGLLRIINNFFNLNLQ
jgi:hypothetical protein